MTQRETTIANGTGRNLLGDLLSRIVSARESLEYGAVDEAATILYELELDVAPLIITADVVLREAA